jgi:hypothetical protein
MFSNLGQNQVMEIIEAARCSVFFLDEDQRVTMKDIGSSAEIEKWARYSGAEIHHLKLSSQFRCNGSDGYMAFLDQLLGIRKTANTDLKELNYDFRVCSSPVELYEEILLKNKERNRARILKLWTSLFQNTILENNGI